MKVPTNALAPNAGRRRSDCRWLSNAWILLLFALVLHGTPTKAQTAVVLVGSGSSVPAPLYARWSQEYNKRNPNIQVRYLPAGTSEGIKQISHGAGDFGAGEAPLTDKEREENGLLEMPVVLVGIVPVYNLPAVHQELRLSGEVLAEIFLGNVKTWNAPQIAKLNPKIALPSVAIQVVNRGPGKGSNYVFTDFLSKTSPKFRSQVGVSASPKWPVGVPAERSSDMVDKVKNSPGSIGYVEYQYAVKNSIPQAAVLNLAGQFVKASPESISEACKTVEASRSNSLAASLVNAPGVGSFPIASFSWMYLRTKAADPGRAAALADFLDWIYTDGQQFAAQEGYSELPTPVLAAAQKKIKDLR